MEKELKEWVATVENDPRILEFRFQYKNMLVWPFVRYHIMETVISVRSWGGIRPQYDQIASKRRLERYAQKLIRSLIRAFQLPFGWKQKDLLYMYRGDGNVRLSDGTYFHRIYDGFVMEYKEKSGVLEHAGWMEGHKSKYIDKKYMDSVYFLVEVLGSWGHTDKRDMLMADELITYLTLNCGIALSEEEAVSIKEMILFFSKAVKYIDKIFTKIFLRIKPKMVFVNCGIYGQWNACIIKCLRDLGIRTAEVQHANVSHIHPAYFFSDFLCNNEEYADYVPDFFVGWSSYWLDSIQIPSKKIPIGNPWFWKQYMQYAPEKYQKERADKRKTILWLPFANIYEDIRYLDDFIKVSSNEYYIRIRLHPTMRHLRDEYIKYNDNDRIIMDNLSHVYESFQMADFVVGEDSTAVYEALAFGKPVFVLSDEVTAGHGLNKVAPSFKSVEELLCLLQDENAAAIDGVREAGRFFGEDWQQKFREFIEQLN